MRGPGYNVIIVNRIFYIFIFDSEDDSILQRDSFWHLATGVTTVGEFTFRTFIISHSDFKRMLRALRIEMECNECNRNANCRAPVLHDSCSRCNWRHSPESILSHAHIIELHLMKLFRFHGKLGCSKRVHQIDFGLLRHVKIFVYYTTETIIFHKGVLWRYVASLSGRYRKTNPYVQSQKRLRQWKGEKPLSNFSNISARIWWQRHEAQTRMARNSNNRCCHVSTCHRRWLSGWQCESLNPTSALALTCERRRPHLPTM